MSLWMCSSMVVVFSLLTLVDRGTCTSVSVTNSQVVDPGSNVTLACNVSGASNTTTVVWNGPNGQLNENVSFYEENTIFVSNLVLNSVGSEDGGTYTCSVTDSDLSNSTVIVITPTITPLEARSNVGDNSPVFMCDAQSSLSSTTRWFMYNLSGNVQEVFNSDSDSGSGSGMSPLSVNAILNLGNENVTFQDAGMYQCAVSTPELGEVRSQNATLTVSPKSSVTIMPNTTNSIQGGLQTFTCSAMGGPGNMFSWTRLYDNITVGNMSDLTVNVSGATDGGEYRCEVSNMAGNDSQVAILNVGPIIFTTPLSVNVSASDALSLNCVATGFPVPNITWFFNEKEYQVDENRTSVIQAIGDRSVNSTLTINMVMLNDSGEYVCNASSPNYDTVSTDPATVMVIVSPSNVMITVSPLNTSIIIRNDNVTFTCDAQGGPGNLYQWQRNGENLDEMTEPILQLTSVDASDGGEYTCVVSNAAGNDSDFLTLYIQPYIVTDPQPQILAANDTQASFTCQAMGFPDPSYRWMKDEDPEFESFDQNLMFSPVMFGDEGTYRCVAMSMQNFPVVSQPGFLIVSPESSVTVMPNTNNSFQGEFQTFTCSAMGGPGNMFSWRRLYDNVIVGNTSNLTVNVGGATDGGQYRCEVSNTAGNGSQVAILNVGPVIFTTPLSVNVSASDALSLNCVATGFPVPTITWFLNGKEYQVDENRTNVTQASGDRSVNSTLTINMAVGNDSGEYVCNVSSPNYDTVSTEPVAVVVIVPPSNVMIALNTSIAMRNDNVTFTCDAQGGPSNLFQWQRNGANLNEMTQPILQLTSVDTSDGGEYTCVVSNAAGDDSNFITLYIQPYIVTDPQPQILAANDTQASFTCEAMGFPDPSYRWMKDEDLEFESFDQNLTFSPVMFGDEGMYRCVALSLQNFTDVSQPGLLIVSPESSVTIMPDTTNSIQGEFQTFTCSAMGGPENMFSWTRLYDNITVGNMSNLTVSVSGATDGGQYRCEVSNMAGNDSQVAILNVGPIIDTPPSSVNVSTSDSTSLTCVASGFPIPSIIWVHNGTEYQEDGSRTSVSPSTVERQTVTSALTINMAMVNDSGEYVCNATSPNYDTVSSEPVLVFVQATPERPQNVTAVEVTTTSVILEWVEPHDNNAPIRGYKVSYTRPSFLGGTDVTINSTVETVNITGLHPGVAYSFSVVAFNDIGDSAPGSVTVTTVETAPSGSPTIDNVMSLSPTEIQVTWTAVSEIEQNGNITRYEVLYRSTLDFTNGSVSTMDGDTFTANITELEEFVVYNITVRAYTVVGPGPFSEVAMETTGGAAPASPPQNVTATVLSSTEIQVNWTEVTEIDQNGIISEYEVMYEPLITFGVLNTTTTTTMNLSTVLYELEEYVEYNISVRAYTNDGAGPYSVGIVRRTFEDVPSSPPNDVNTISVSSTEIRVTWQEVKAIDRNGNITHYEVMYNGKFDDMNQSNFTDGNIQNFTITGLDEFSEYNISVRAYTSVGPGPYSQAEKEVTEEDVPASPPLNVIASVLSSTEIQMNWTEIPEMEQNGIIIEYEVMYEPQMTFNGVLTTRSVNTTNIFVTLTGLQEYVEYSISVRAYTRVGPGPYSVEIFRRTLEDVPGSSPRNLQVIATGPTSLNVSWEPPVEMDINGILTNYTIEYYITEEENSAHDVMVVSSATFTVSLENLNNFTIYNVSVSANTVVGRGPITERTQRTDENVPGEAPQNVTVNSESSTSIRVEWDPPRENFQFGIIRSYIVLYRVTMETDPAMAINVTNRSLIIESLMEFTNYSVEVTAVTVGEGPYSDPVTVVTDQDIPGVVARPPDNQSVISPFSANVSWNPPVDPNGIITQYTVNYFIVSNDTMSTRRRRQVPMPTVIDPVCVVGGMENINRNISVTGELTFTILENLTPYTVYEFRVQAETSVGPGLFSLPRSFCTPEDVPTEPRSLSVQTLSSTSLEVTWESPRCNFGVRTGYNVSHDPIMGAFLGTVGTLSNPSIQSDPNAGNITITGLSPFTNYTVSICALTSAGCGNISSNTSQTNEDVPSSPPSNVSAMAVSSTVISVMWQEVAAIDRNGIIIHYEVMYNGEFDAMNQSNFTDGNIRILNITGLDEFADYNISVRAYTSVGPGPYSQAEREMTEEDVPDLPPRNVTANVLSSTEVGVNWTDIPEINRNGIIIFYEVLYEQLSISTATIVNTSNLFIILNDLEPGQIYNISVRGVTSVGSGPYSTPEQMVLTDEDTPGPVPPPAPPSPNDTTATSVLVSWTRPPNANGVIRNYTINFVAVRLMSEPSSARRKRQTVDNTTLDNSLDNCIVGGQDMVNRFQTVPGEQNSANLTNLTPYTVYEFRVQAATDVGVGNFSTTTQFSTMESVPSAPRNLTVTYDANNSTILKIEWIQPLCDNGNRIHYIVNYSSIESDGETGCPVSGQMYAADRNSLTVNSLTPNTAYNVSIMAFTSAGGGVPEVEIGRTNEDAPPAVMSLVLISLTNDDSDRNVSVIVSWIRPSNRNGPYSYRINSTGTQMGAYVETVVDSRTVNSSDTGENTTTYMFNGLASAVYTIAVSAVNIKTGRSSLQITTMNTTVSIAPTSVNNLNAVAVNSTALRVTWDQPSFPNGAITRYDIYYRESSNTDPQSIQLGEPQNEEVLIDGLKPFTFYSISVQAVGASGLKSPVMGDVLMRTNSAIPPIIVLPTDEPTPEATAITITINLPSANFVTGPLQFYGVVVDLTPTDDSDLEQGYPGIGPYPYMPEAPYYIAGAWTNSTEIPGSFTVGDGSTTTANGENYVNVALKADTLYSFLVRVEIVSDNSQPLVQYSQQVVIMTPLSYSPGGVAVGILFLIAAIVAAVIGVVIGLWWYRKKYYLHKLHGYAENDLEFEDTSGQYTIANESLVSHNISNFVHVGTLEPIPVSHFKAHVNKMHANDDYLFSEEYANVEPTHSPTTEATHFPYNTPKNRYANIPSYDHSRVRLSEIPNRPGSDYINGNYIDGYHQPNAFVATQGPVPDSVNDFWRMVWEQGAATIVMVTNLQEKGRIKCHQYWPDDRGCEYGGIQVHIQEILTLADYTVRTFSVQKKDSKEERILTQFHYTVWPDHGVPDNPTPLLHFVRKVTSTNPTNAGPIVVHCSAGVGRTGTFITLFSQLKMIRMEHKIDLFGFVRSMRYNRCCMVQTELQYVFAHDALLEAVECGVHEVAARDLKEQYKKLGALDSTLGLTKLEVEFDNLDGTIHRRPTKNVGTLNINKFKNRYANAEMIPYDSTRCRLSFIPGVDGSDYINANLIAGYHKRCAFIATQAPLPDTVEDFWRMVWEKQSATIVILTQEREAGKVKCHRYWPSTGAENYGSLQVILHAVSEYPDYTLRELKIIDIKDGSSLPVKQFQYTGWPEEGVPDSGSGFIDLIGQVQKWQRSSGDKPIVAHCSGGTGRTGTFIAVSILLERLKTEGVVDVFHTVRGLRLQRPGMVHTVDQYEFVYKTVLEYLDSFELYANFK